MKTNDILLIMGAGGHGRVAADIALKMGTWQKVVFADDNDSIKTSMGLNVICRFEDTMEYIKNCDIFVALGDNKTRSKIQSSLEGNGAKIPVLIHPCSVISSDVKIGNGTVVMAGAVINCGTKIGKGCIVNTGTTIDHDNIIEDYVNISPGAHLAGAVNVGKFSWLGIGCIVSNNIKIAANCIAGAGCVVISDITEKGTYVGVPARRLV